MESQQLLPFMPALLLTLLFCFSQLSVEAVSIGVQKIDDVSASGLSEECSRKCESDFCFVPPFLRYGKYCGLRYSGCPGERPCDGLDACCMNHDACVQSKNNGYLSQECSKKLLRCMQSFKRSGAHSFEGSTCDSDQVIDVISVAIKAALLAGRFLHKP
uniref:phospholipase A2 n=1 Tax=Kalanchoe fedtschenkoi TaxID=63787 RepID=A0A7N1A2Z0_KALFE